MDDTNRKRPRAPVDHGRGAGPADRAAARETGPKRVASHELLGPSGELLITHGGREYRLRVTQYGKLILTA